MKELLGQEVELLIIGGITGVGVLVRLLLFCCYTSLGKACRVPHKTKNKVMAYIRKDLKQKEEEKQIIKNVALYTECRLAERRIAGIRLGALECAWQQSTAVVLLGGVLTALGALLWGEAINKVIFLFFVGGMGLFGLMLMDLLGGIKEKSVRVRLCIREYIENGGTNCMADGVEPAEKLRRKEEKKRRKEEEKNIRVVNRKKSKGKALEEKKRLTEELLRERRQLEARSLAEQRRRVREDEIAGGGAEAEAAVTESPEPVVAEQAEPNIAECAEPVLRASSYEELLSDVLSEYLA